MEGSWSEMLDRENAVSDAERQDREMNGIVEIREYVDSQQAVDPDDDSPGYPQNQADGCY